jgi:radical SAM protein with 4Fe4S-binding SPASM domain
MKIQNYGDWSLDLHQRVVAQRVPVSGSLEITQRCNLKCTHCYNRLPLSDKEARRDELTYDEHCRILDEITAAGCLWLLYTGGEIFARKDFLDIYTYAKQKGLIVSLFTNGTLITPKVADYLVRWRPFGIEITLYGRTKETYERVTGIPGSYERCMQGIKLLMERELPLKLKTMAITINKHEIWEMKRYVEEDLGLEFKFDAMINPRIDCSQSPLNVRLTPEEVVELDLLDPKRASEWRKFAKRFNAPTPSAVGCSDLYQCGGGISAFAVDPSGKTSICVLSHGEAWDLGKGSFQDGWERFLLKVRKKKITRHTKCVDCKIKPMCGACPAYGELENGEPEAPVDFLCHVAHLRAYALGIPVPPSKGCEYCKGGSKYKDLMQVVGPLHQGKPIAVSDELSANDDQEPAVDGQGSPLRGA